MSFDEESPEGEFNARIVVPADSPWFDGHFPEAPVLPGIAQLGMVHELLANVLGQTRPIERVSRVRFKQMIRPDEEATLTVLATDKPGGYRFRINGAEGLICSGQIRLAA